MMVDFNKVMRGVEHYLDNEVLAKMGWQRWVIGTAVELYANNAKEIYNNYKDKDLIKMLGIVNGDMIDLDKVHSELVKQASKGQVTIDLPMNMGKLTLSRNDVDLLHNYIINA